MAAPQTRTHLGPCPTDEEIAAFLDHALSAAERARITAHLADCESCCETFAGVVNVLSELAEATPNHPATRLIPGPRSRSNAPGRARAWWPATAVAAALALAIALPLYRWLSTPPPMVVADLIAPLTPTALLAHRLHETRAMRGDLRQTALLSPSPSFLVGVFEVDLRLSLAARDLERSSRILLRLGTLLHDVDYMETQGDAYQAASQRLTSAEALRRFAVEAPAREAALEGESSSLLPEWVDFGKWTEAGRLAAASQAPYFFKARANRRFLSFLLRERRAPLDPEVKAALRNVDTLWDFGRFAPGDFAALETELDKVIARTETLLLEGRAQPTR
jgi:hypothetical protein